MSANILPDGHVVPSYMNAQPRGTTLRPQFSNFGLRQGEVREIVYPKDARSVSHRFTEYIVEVQQDDTGSAHGASTLYMGCLVANLFGGVADKLRYTLRPDPQGGSDGIGIGSKVLMLCIDGHTDAAIIIGGIPDAHWEPGNDTPGDGHHFFFEFNGLSIGVNKDGEFKLQFRGRTKHDGKLDTANGASEEAQPTTLEIKKNGNLEITTKDSAQFIKLDHEQKKIFIQADKEWNVKISEAWKVSAGKETEFDLKDRCSITIGKKWLVDCGDEIEIDASKRVLIKSMGVHIGGATENFPMFSTYRQQEMMLHSKLGVGLAQASTQLGVAAGLILGAAAVHKIPVAGPIIASPALEQAGQAMLQVVAALAQMGTAIASFETLAPTYISLKNRND